MYSIVFFPFFAKSCFNSNHNNINMNDIQNSNNYIHIITLSSSALVTLPPGLQATGGHGAVVVPPSTFHGGPTGSVAKAPSVNLEYVTVSKKRFSRSLGLMCDGGWGLVCPEAHEAAAAWETQGEKRCEVAMVTAHEPCALMKTRGDHVETLRDTNTFTQPENHACKGGCCRVNTVTNTQRFLQPHTLIPQTPIGDFGFQNVFSSAKS